MFAPSRFLSVFFSIVVSAFIGQGGEPTVRSAEAAEVIERFSTRQDSHWIMLPVEIKEKRYSLFLDTGSYCTGYDRPLWHLMGKTIALQKIGDADENITVPFFQPPDARLGQFALPKDSLVLGSDLREFREDSGEEIHGFLGMDFLKKHIFRMDLDRSEIVFLRAVGPDPGHRLAVTLKDDQPYVRINLPGLKEPEEFILDTGAARTEGWHGGCLRKASFESLVQSSRLFSVGNHPLGGLAGWRIRRSGYLDSFPFAGDTHKSLSFSESDVSLLGLGLLSRYVVTFDFPHQAIYLKKGRQFDQPIRYDRSGLWVRRVKGQTGVASVAEGSAAAKAGIFPGDVLFQIDKEQINGMTLFTLRDRLCEEGKKIHLTIRRGEQQMDVPVVLSSDK